MRPARILFVILLGLAAFAACGDDGGNDNGAGNNGSGSGQSFCATAREIYEPSDPQPQTEAEPEDVVDAFRSLEETAPPEIAAEAKMLREYIAVLFGTEEPSSDAPDQATIVAAENKVRDYLEDECGIEPSTTTAPSAA